MPDLLPAVWSVGRSGSSFGAHLVAADRSGWNGTERDVACRGCEGELAATVSRREGVKCSQSSSGLGEALRTRWMSWCALPSTGALAYWAVMGRLALGRACPRWPLGVICRWLRSTSWRRTSSWTRLGCAWTCRCREVLGELGFCAQLAASAAPLSSRTRGRRRSTGAARVLSQPGVRGGDPAAGGRSPCARRRAAGGCAGEPMSAAPAGAHGPARRGAGPRRRFLACAAVVVALTASAVPFSLDPPPRFLTAPDRAR